MARFSVIVFVSLYYMNLDDIEYNKEKLKEYYTKTLEMSKILLSHKELDNILPLYEHYFILLNKMKHYHHNIRTILTKTKMSHTLDNKLHQLEHQIKRWKSDAKQKYKKIELWLHEKNQYIHEKQILTDQIHKLQTLYQQQEQILRQENIKIISFIMEYNIYNINSMIDDIYSLDSNKFYIETLNILRNENNTHEERNYEVITDLLEKMLNNMKTNSRYKYVVEHMEIIIHSVKEEQLYINISHDPINTKNTNNSLKKYITSLHDTYHKKHKNQELLTILDQKYQDHLKLLLT